MLGREIELSKTPERVVAITSASAEILYAIGSMDKVVGVGKYADYPKEATKLPILESGSNVNVEQILALEPDVVFTSDIGISESQMNSLEKAGVKVVATEADTIEQVYTSIELTGKVMGKADEAEKLVLDMKNALIILLVLVFLVPRILLNSKALDVFSIGERNAENIGINVKKVKLDVILCVSAIIGVCVAFTGTIGFVGLIMPHILRKFVGPSHNKLLPISMFGGSIFLLLADLISRTVLRPIELPIGVVTSFVGSILFVYIYYNMRKVR